MNYPIIEQIAQALAVAAGRVKVANGYQVDVSGVVRMTATGIDQMPGNNGVLILQEPPSRQSGLDVCGGGRRGIAWRQPFKLMIFVAVSDSATAPLEQLINILVADVTRAVMADPGFGSLAIDSEIASLEYVDFEGRRAVGAEMVINVDYRVLENDPYTKI